MDTDILAQVVVVNIETLMERRGINAAELARRAKMNSTGVYDILKRKSNNPRLDTLAKLAEALDVSLVEIISQPSDDEMRSQVLSVYEKLPEVERQRLLQTAQAWLPDQQPA